MKSRTFLSISVFLCILLILAGGWLGLMLSNKITFPKFKHTALLEKINAQKYPAPSPKIVEWVKKSQSISKELYPIIKALESLSKKGWYSDLKKAESILQRYQPRYQEFKTLVSHPGCPKSFPKTNPKYGAHLPMTKLIGLQGLFWVQKGNPEAALPVLLSALKWHMYQAKHCHTDLVFSTIKTISLQKTMHYLQPVLSHSKLSTASRKKALILLKQLGTQRLTNLTRSILHESKRTHLLLEQQVKRLRSSKRYWESMWPLYDLKNTQHISQFLHQVAAYRASLSLRSKPYWVSIPEEKLIENKYDQWAKRAGSMGLLFAYNVKGMEGFKHLKHFLKTVTKQRNLTLCAVAATRALALRHAPKGTPRPQITNPLTQKPFSSLKGTICVIRRPGSRASSQFRYKLNPAVFTPPPVVAK